MKTKTAATGLTKKQLKEVKWENQTSKGKKVEKPSKNFFDLTDKEKKILVERAAKESSADQVRKYGTPNLLTLGREKKPKVDKAFQVFIIEHDNAVIKEYREKLRKKIERKEKGI